jgi:CheY-like chemotaxis protein
MQDTLPADAPQHDDLGQIRQAAERAATMTKQLLAFSRQQVLQPTVLDLNAVVTGISELLKRMIGEDIGLHTSLDPGLGRIKADKGQLDQVLLNLAVNARDAMPKGGQLTIETHNIEVDKAYARKRNGIPLGQYVLLAVTDTGIGMDAATQASIFEPFFTTKEAGKGTGLGLAMVYGIVKQSGGFIWVYSEVGHGTTFKIYLPRVDEVALSRPAEGDKEKISTGSETLLIVEDEPMVRNLALRFLKTQGYQVLMANNGEEALRLAGAHRGPIHMLVTDMVMPGLTGQQLAEKLVSVRPEMKVLYVSGYTSDAIVRHWMLEVGTAFLQKPYSQARLLRKVRDMLDGTE